MLDIITVIMCYYFQSSIRSIWFQLNTAALWSFLLGPLENVLCSPPFLAMGACNIKKNGWATVKDNPCSKLGEYFHFHWSWEFFCPLSPLDSSTGEWRGQGVHTASSPHCGGMGQAGASLGRKAGGQWKGLMQVGSFSLNSCLRVAGVYCCGGFGLCCCSVQEQPGRNSPRGKNTSGRKEAIIAGCLFVANRMLKWQICKFVREGSLVFIFISQSGFLLAEQQARKRLILTT